MKEKEYYKRIDYYREQINAIDKILSGLLSLRFMMVEEIASHKKKLKIRITDKKRESEVIDSIRKELQKASKLKNYPNKKIQKLIINVFKDIIKHSKKIQSA